MFSLRCTFASITFITKNHPKHLYVTGYLLLDIVSYFFAWELYMNRLVSYIIGFQILINHSLFRSILRCTFSNMVYHKFMCIIYYIYISVWSVILLWYSTIMQHRSDLTHNKWTFTSELNVSLTSIPISIRFELISHFISFCLCIKFSKLTLAMDSRIVQPLRIFGPVRFTSNHLFYVDQGIFFVPQSYLSSKFSSSG